MKRILIFSVASLAFVGGLILLKKKDESESIENTAERIIARYFRRERKGGLRLSREEEAIAN